VVKPPNEELSLRSPTEDVYGEIREHITSALDRSRGGPTTGGRGPQSGPWTAWSPDTGADSQLVESLRPLVDRQYDLGGDLSSKLNKTGRPMCAVGSTDRRRVFLLL
jgi:hypothetical protein